MIRLLGEVPTGNTVVVDYILKFLMVVGIMSIRKTLMRFVRTLFYMIKPAAKLRQRYGEGSWAVVTGASDGIGRGFCEELAKDGLNVCLVSRTKEKLEQVAEHLKQLNPNVQTRVIACDFTRMPDSSSYDALLSQLSGLDVSILVNNVGMNNVEAFEVVNEKRLHDEIVVNCLPITILTRRLLPAMLKREKKSAVINLSSLMGEIPFPNSCTYNATKAFDDMLSRGISRQHPDKIDVLSVRPMYVTTTMTFQYKGLLAVTPNQCARGSLNMLGVEEYTHGHWFHRLQAQLVNIIPLSLIHALVTRKTKEHIERNKQPSS